MIDLISLLRQKLGKDAAPISPIPQQDIVGMARNQVPRQPSQKNTYSEAIRRGFEHWGGKDLPASKYADYMASEMRKYPIYKKYPFLIPAITILESGAGSKLDPDSSDPHKKYNLTSWGIKLSPQDFVPQSMKHILERTTSGIGQRTPYYNKFRETQDLLDLADIYAPLKDNPETGGKYYAQHLQEVMDIFQKVYDEINRKE